MREQAIQAPRLGALTEQVLHSIQRTFSAHIPLYACAVLFTGATAAIANYYRIPLTFDATAQFLEMAPLFLGGTVALVAIFELFRLARSGFPPNPAAMIGNRIRNLVLTEDRPGNVFHAIVALTPLMIAFAALKVVIPYIHPFVWDETFMKWDLVLGGGKLPWERLQPLLGYPAITAALSILYDLWFAAMFGTLFSVAFAKRNDARRMQFLLAFSFCWFIAGNVLATVFSSAGPCFYHGVVSGPDPYAAQMIYLRDVSKHWINWSVAVQELLWNSYAIHKGPELGISAMPSMHMAIATLLACIGWGAGRMWRTISTAFALLIGLGAIHLGWHYASDVFAGAFLAVFFWYTAGLLSRHALSSPTIAKKPIESVA
ncbi:MAG TPA: phosphatase PAP2 family protein [Rhizomicrobium sp.]|jgi:membrane-associated phospholipid phosphatase